MKVTIKHGSILKCDMPGCPTQFVSYSHAVFLRPQAKLAKWGRAFVWQIDPDTEWPQYKCDVCPVHAEIAEEAKARRPIELAEKKAAAKATRAIEVTRRAEERITKRAARNAAREKHAAELRARADARAAKKAAKIAAQNQPAGNR